MATWPGMPPEVVTYVREVFAEANRQATELLVNMPNVRETTLDDHLINALLPQSPPHRLASGCVVEMDIHNIGGLRRVYSWETADIAVLVFVYQGARMVGQKIGLLQSKRLFPQTGEVIDEDEVGFRYGINAMLNRSSSSPLGSLSRRFVFDGDCLYSAIKVDEQMDVIERHNREFGESVYYLLYAPPALPTSVTYPVTSRVKLTTADNGCFVLDAPTVHEATRALPKGASPEVAPIAWTGWRRR